MIYFVPTPIGNRDDITLRAIDTLKQVDLITCEDTRHSRPLLEHYQVSKPLIALHDHNEAKKTLLVLASPSTHSTTVDFSQSKKANEAKHSPQPLSQKTHPSFSSPHTASSPH